MDGWMDGYIRTSDDERPARSISFLGELLVIQQSGKWKREEEEEEEVEDNVMFRLDIHFSALRL